MSRSAIATSTLSCCSLAPARTRSGRTRAKTRALRSSKRAARSCARASSTTRQALDQAITLNPRRVEAYVLRSAVYAAKKQYKDGIALMRGAQALAPQERRPDRARLAARARRATSTRASRCSSRSSRGSRKRYDAQLLLGRYLHDTGKWPDAITVFEAYFAHRPRSSAGHARHASSSPMPTCATASRKRRSRCSSARRRAPKNDLRARSAIAWATAAIDCKKARGALHDLEAVAKQYPEVWLVDGQCALALGEPAGALGARQAVSRARPRRRRRRATRSSARRRRRAATSPTRGRSSSSRARSSRSAGAGRCGSRSCCVARTIAADALAALDKLGPPSAPAYRSGLVDRARRGAARARRRDGPSSRA